VAGTGVACGRWSLVRKKVQEWRVAVMGGVRPEFIL
jgi:hypothetical protein